MHSTGNRILPLLLRHNQWRACKQCRHGANYLRPTALKSGPSAWRQGPPAVTRGKGGGRSDYSSTIGPSSKFCRLGLQHYGGPAVTTCCTQTLLTLRSGPSRQGPPAVTVTAGIPRPLGPPIVTLHCRAYSDTIGREGARSLPAAIPLVLGSGAQRRWSSCK